MTRHPERKYAAFGWPLLAVVIMAWVAVWMIANAIWPAEAGETSATLSVSVTIPERPVSIQTPDEAEGVTITGEEIAAWCEEFGLFTGECLIDPAEVRALFDDDINPIEE